MSATTQTCWWDDRANLAALTRFMADADYTADQVSYAVEKPWKHEDVWAEVQQRVAEDAAFAGIVWNYSGGPGRTVRLLTFDQAHVAGLDRFDEQPCPTCDGSKRHGQVACGRCAAYGVVYVRRQS